MNNKIKIYQEILENEILTIDLMNMFLGSYIGRGIHRIVFEYDLDKNYVIKLDDSDKGANIIEWEVWKSVQCTNHAKWFAPIKSISTCGKVLIQRRCKSMNETNRPKKVPAYFTDTHSDNFGILNGKVVCLDYACNLLLENGLTNKMKAPRWTEGTKSFS